MRYVGLVIFLILPAVTLAAVYKWIDDDGNVHYGDKPTASEPSVEVDVDEIVSVPLYDSNKGSMSREERRERLLQSMEEDRLEKREQREKQQALKKQNRKKCNRYRDRMRHYERARAVYRLDKDGNRVFMSDADRTKATKNLQKKINKYCR